MNNIKELAQKIQKLEQECQQGINVSKNLKEMEEIMLSLPFEKLLELNEEIEKKILTK